MFRWRRGVFIYSKLPLNASTFLTGPQLQMSKHLHKHKLWQYAHHGQYRIIRIGAGDHLLLIYQIMGAVDLYMIYSGNTLINLYMKS